MNLKEALAHYLPHLEEEMRRALAGEEPRHEAFYGMLFYHLGWVDEHFRPDRVDGGKRLRPLFTLLACQAAGGDPRRALPAAAAIELVHNFSLIHDDIQDRSETRRGRKTVWMLWGEAQGINAGDTLFTLARRALLRLAETGLPAETTLQAIRKLDDTCLDLCYGQHLDLSFEDRLDVDVDSYLTMIRGKTAALLGAAGYLGALAAGAGPETALKFGQLGEEMGLAFQIQDDILGIWGDEATTGKPAADDIRRRKKSLPVVYVLSRPAADPDAALLRQRYRQEALSEEDVARILEVLNRAGARSYAEQVARRHIDAASRILAEVITPSADSTALQELAEYLIQRER